MQRKLKKFQTGSMARNIIQVGYFKLQYYCLFSIEYFFIKLFHRVNEDKFSFKCLFYPW